MKQIVKGDKQRRRGRKGQLSAADRLFRSENTVKLLAEEVREERERRERTHEAHKAELRDRDSLIFRLKSDHAFALNRLGARLSALEFTTVLAHQHSGRLSEMVRSLEVARGQDSAYAAVEPDQGEVATPFPSPAPRYRRNGDRWELITT